MKDDARIGLFLCHCGGKISDRLDLVAVDNLVKNEEGVAHTEIMPFWCLSPGLEALQETVKEKDLNRVIMGGCSERLMTKKFVKALEAVGLEEPQFGMVNLRDHVAQVNLGDPEELARKGAALVSGATASMRLLEPHKPIEVEFNGPALIMGGGVSGFNAARELAKHGMESVIITQAEGPDDVLRELPRTYPGNVLYRGELGEMIGAVFEDPRVTVKNARQVEYLTGHLGEYRVGLKDEAGEVAETLGSSIVLALDRKFTSGNGSYFGDGERIIDQIEMERRMVDRDIPDGNALFWINDREIGGESPEISAAAAWHNSLALTRDYPNAAPTILYPNDIRLPLTVADLGEARRLGISLVPYRAGVHPTVQVGYVTYLSADDHMEKELQWDMMVLSSVPEPEVQFQDLIRWLPIFVENSGKIAKSPIKLRPGQHTDEGLYLTGSAAGLGDIDEMLRQGKNAAKGILGLRERAQNGGLKSPAVVVSIDQDLCEGCGLCSEICPCGGVETKTTTGGAEPRRVDPHACTGGGTCAAACPYDAAKVLNNTTQQLEARVRAVLSRMNENEAIGFVCAWGGMAAADLAGIKGYTYNSGIYLIPVNCLGSIDPAVLSMAFLNGVSGILLAGCPPGICHYSHGVDHTWNRANFIKKLLTLSGLDRRRIALGYADVNQPEAFVRLVDSFMERLAGLGPMPTDEETKKMLLAMHATVHRPRVRWILGVGLRRPAETDYPADQRSALEFDRTMLGVLGEEYLAARVLNLVAQQALNTRQIADALGIESEKIAAMLPDMVKEGRITREGWVDSYPVYTILA